MLLGVVAVGACTGPDDRPAVDTTVTTVPVPVTTTTSTTQAPEPVIEHAHGGEVIVGIDREPTSLNFFSPLGPTETATRIGATYWAGVWRLDGATLEQVPDVVTEIPTLRNRGIVANEDGTLTVHYTVREEAVWADGVPISGDDFAFTLEAILDPRHPFDRAVYDTIDPASIVVEPKAFEFRSTAPITALSDLFGVLLPKHDVEGRDLLTDFHDTMWVSGGPFMFEEWAPGRSITVVRNPRYWGVDPETGQQLPYLDRIVFRLLDPATGPAGSLVDGAVDVVRLGQAGLDDTLIEIEALATPGAEPATVQVVSAGSWEQLGFQFGPNRHLANPASYNEHLEFRRAVAHAIDRKLLAERFLAGLSEPLASYVDAYLPALSGSWWLAYEHDPELAREYLAELCAKPGVDCDEEPPSVVLTVSHTPMRIELADMLAAMFEEVGIGFEVRIEAAGAFFGATLDHGSFDLASWTWQARPTLDALVHFHRAVDPGGSLPPERDALNFQRWGTPEVEFPSGSEHAGTPLAQGPSSVMDESTQRYAELMSRLPHATTDRSIVAIIAELESILADQVVFIPLFQHVEAGAYRSDRLDGYVYAPHDFPDTWNAGRWHRIDR